MKKTIKKLIKKGFQNLGIELRRATHTPASEKPIEQQKRKKIQVGSFELMANEAHPIDRHLKRHVEYSRNLPRIARFLTEKWTNCGIIDIGANIGDTVALLRSEGVDNAIYCVEPISGYFDLLKHNAQQFSNLKLFNFWLNEFSNKILDDNKNRPLSIEIKNGTARQITNGHTTELATMTLDELVGNQSITNVKLLKIDTDGYDFKIIRGGMNFIKQQKPVLFFEYDAVYLTDNKEDGWATLALLSDAAHYEQALYYDNFGRFLCSISLKNERLAKQLFRYMQEHRGAFPYFDVCLFHENDTDLAEKIIQEEEKRM